MLQKIIRLLNNPDQLWLTLDYHGFFRTMGDEKNIRIKYRMRTGRELDLDNPTRFNEKLQWIKLYDRRPEYSVMADKYMVREYITEKLGDQYLIPFLGVWDNPQQISFDKLPEQFVLKCNHDSGSVVICRDKSKFDKKAALKKLSKGLKRNGFWYGREWPYKNIKPRVIAEKCMTDESGTELKDYKVMCFNGERALTASRSSKKNSGDIASSEVYNDRMTSWNMVPNMPASRFSDTSPSL